jgi:large subunit ribosomal protein L23
MSVATTERDFIVLRTPHVSEKTARVQAAHNQYVFKVDSTATKTEVKSAVEAMFKVKVESVQVANIAGKAKAFRSRQGKRQGYRKAYVTLGEGQTIDFGLKA